MPITKKTVTRGFLAYVLFAIALQPAAFQHFGPLKKLFYALQIGMCLFVCVLELIEYANNRGFKSISRIAIALGFYYVYLLAVTILHHGLVEKIAMQAAHFVGFVLYLDLVLKNNPKEVFRSMLNILTFYVTVNFVITLVMPGGLYATDYFENNYLLGYDNQNINFMLPTLILVLLKNECDKPCRGQVVFTFTVVLATAIRIWSGMTLVVVVVTALFAIVIINGKGILAKKVFSGSIFNFLNLLILNIGAFVGLVFFQVQNYFAFFIEDVLHKSLTLTGRTVIWERTIDLIAKQPLFGYGKEAYEFRAVKHGFFPDNPAGLHCHNRFLETMYMGGIVLTAIYGIILFYAAFCLQKIKHTKTAKILAFGLFIYMVGMLTEFYDYCLLFWGLLVMAENCKILEGLKHR